MEKFFEQQRGRNCELASRLESAACQLDRDVPTEIDSATLTRRGHELLAVYRELLDVAGDVARAAGECRMAAFVVGSTPVDELSAEDLAEQEGR